MRMKQTTEFTFQGDTISYDEFDQIWNAVQAAGKDCTVNIHQTNFNEPPYGVSTTTYIEVESK